MSKIIYNFKKNKNMKYIERLKEKAKKREIERRLRVLEEDAFHFTVKNNQVFIICNQVAVKSMPIFSKVEDILNEINKIKEIAKNYERE